MRRAKCFGINLARLDILKEVRDILKRLDLLKKYKSNYLDWDEDQKLKF